jgi:branched-chain amino acid transport system permease protein
VISSLDRFILPQGTGWLHALGVNVDLTGSRFLIYGLILVLMMLLRPEGLLPSHQRKAELRAAKHDVTAAAQEQAVYSEAVS